MRPIIIFDLLASSVCKIINNDLGKNYSVQTLEHNKTGSWDAYTYDEVSRLVQYKWGQQLINGRIWHGNEIVIDAGCGSGLLTKELAKKVSKGKVYAVDIDSNMIKQAKTNLQAFDNVEIIQSSFTEIAIPEKVDVIFSNSALHWITDHRKAFQSFWENLRPTSTNSNNDNNSQLLIQCGGYGNLQQIIHLVEQITQLGQFKRYFADWKQPWYFPMIDDTNKLLREIGYTNIRTNTNSDCVFLPNRQIYSKFVKTVVLKSYLDHLSEKNGEDIDKLKDLFLELFLDEVEKCNNKSNNRWFLDFIRLNIIAYRIL